MSKMSELDILIKERSGMIQPKYYGKWFTSLDHTFCMHGTCRVRFTCRRYYDNYLWHDAEDYRMIEMTQGTGDEGCELYVGEEKE